MITNNSVYTSIWDSNLGARSSTSFNLITRNSLSFFYKKFNTYRFQGANCLYLDISLLKRFQHISQHPNEIKHSVSILFTQTLNTLRPRKKCHCFADEISKRIFVNQNIRISLNILLKFISEVRINYILAFNKIMVWRRTVASHYLNQ